MEHPGSSALSFQPALVLLMAGAALAAAATTGCRPDRQEPTSRRVVVYTALDRSFSEPILTEFERRTGIKTLTVYDTESTKSIGLASRIVAERRRPRCDVYWNNEILNTLLLKREGLLRPTRPPNAAFYDDSVKDPAGYWYGFAARARILIVNTDKVSDSEMPRSMYDLLNPKWKGRIGIAKPTAGTTASHVACLFAQLGQTPAIDYFNRLRANDVSILSGNKACAQNVATGALLIAWTDTDDAVIEIDAGKPVQIIYPDSTPSRRVRCADHSPQGVGTLFIPNTLAAIKDSPNPDEADRLIDYLLSAGVEAMLAQGPSAQIPLNRACRVDSRVHVGSAVRTTPQAAQSKPVPMNVDFERAADRWGAAQKYIRQTFLH